MRVRKPTLRGSTEPQEAPGADESLERFLSQASGTQRLREAASGLIVAVEELLPEMRKQRREDNKKMKEIHSKVRRRKKHGRQ